MKKTLMRFRSHRGLFLFGLQSPAYFFGYWDKITVYSVCAINTNICKNFSFKIVMHNQIIPYCAKKERLILLILQNVFVRSFQRRNTCRKTCCIESSMHQFPWGYCANLSLRLSFTFRIQSIEPSWSQCSCLQHWLFLKFTHNVKNKPKGGAYERT